MVPAVAINVVGVLIAAIASFVVGTVWYSPALFGKKWMKLMGMKESDMKNAKKEMGGMMVMTLILSVVTAFVLAHILKYVGAVTYMDALFVAFMVWLGFYATSLYMGVLYEKKSMEWWFIIAGNYLAGLIVMAIVLVLV
jgi:hypothetical protein